MTTEKKISLLYHWISFLLLRQISKHFLKILQKGPSPTHFSDPTCPKNLSFLVCGARQQ